MHPFPEVQPRCLLMVEHPKKLIFQQKRMIILFLYAHPFPVCLYPKKILLDSAIESLLKKEHLYVLFLNAHLQQQHCTKRRIQSSGETSQRQIQSTFSQKTVVSCNYRGQGVLIAHHDQPVPLFAREWLSSASTKPRPSTSSSELPRVIQLTSKSSVNKQE